MAYGRVTDSGVIPELDPTIPVTDLGLRSGYDLDPRRLRAGAGALREWDLVHLHAFNLPMGIVTSASRLPVVFTDHGNAALGRTRELSDRGRFALQRRFLRARCVATVANSQWTANRLMESRLAPKRLSVIHNGIDPRRARVPESRETGPLTLAYVGRLAGFKRVDRLVRALSLRDGSSARAIIVGDGPVRGGLGALAYELGCADRIEFLGFRPDVEAILSKVDVLVQPSQAEPFGLAVLEGCLAGALPVVFADGGGVLEVLPPDARVVADEKDLASTIAELNQASDWRTAAAKRRRVAWAAEMFPIARTAHAYQLLYLEVMTRP